MSAHTDNERSEAAVDVPRLVVPENRFATFDNPETGDREWYRNGQIRAKVDKRLIEMARKHPGPNNPFTYEALEPWESGRITGDESAIFRDNDPDQAAR